MSMEARAGRVGFGNGSSDALEEGGTDGLEVVSSRCLILTGLRRRLRALLEELEAMFEGFGDILTGKTSLKSFETASEGLRDLKRRAELEAQPLDFEKSGPAQHYCVECAKYYETDAALTSHWRSKVHKRRCKQLKEPAYTIESERVAGLGRAERKPPTVAAVMEDVVLAT
ncbi:hypothetical protein DFH08DRAFT_806933 [Mycena albidolilacea]|uniref:C2H2-type domain-containing protein n=1 Tax=Mycena albidolilacea TaxID=1033008 RepID=A0AAD7A5R2_9AGAR|nr:hypothetical protein DFH08DRAFT_806933 [Mycena albidolilacea]